ncbi:hypothetical protein PGT21_011234 [Puccinia graminis f. sp. tritici]|uniref:Kinase n=1 Tax=Puccinia graminis f. sp. tritici TaxID=56615 RepID=A0A5B0NWF6_PUCGR|nr:hypothetical protein PGT21_011234 [Puccinia graminis f. sp. tritici]KAA1092149.1 hypothetical protein PGTUg99_007965 [Puccinia graminis f. sp. tritici]
MLLTSASRAMCAHNTAFITSQNHDISECFLSSAGVLSLPSTICYCHEYLSFELCSEDELQPKGQMVLPLLRQLKSLNLDSYYGDRFRGEEQTIPSLLQRLPFPQFKPCREQEETGPVLIQAGGHQGRLGIYHNDPTRILKETYQDEADFYMHVAPKLDNLLEEPYRGSWKPSILNWEKSSMKKNGRDRAFIVLENIAPVSLHRKAGKDPNYFWHPNVIDIKLGKRLYGDKSKPSTKVRKKRLAITTTLHLLGMRLTGAQIWDNKQEKYESISKLYGHYVKEQDLKRKFNYFFPILNVDTGSSHEEYQLRKSLGGLPKEMMKTVVESLISQLKNLTKNVSKFKWCTFNTSLLIVYEGDVKRLKTLNTGSPTKPTQEIAHVRLIDFPHAREDDTPDQAINLGLQTTLDLFENLYFQLNM